mgnify:CR=1 FL=1
MVDYADLPHNGDGVAVDKLQDANLCKITINYENIQLIPHFQRKSTNL